MWWLLLWENTQLSTEPTESETRGWRPTVWVLTSLAGHSAAAAATAKSLQSCPTLCGPIDGSPPGSPVPGILQARTLEWVAISFSNAGKWKRSRSVVSDSLRPRGLQPTRLPRPWGFPGRSTEVGCHCLLWQDIWLLSNTGKPLACWIFSLQ